MTPGFQARDCPLCQGSATRDLCDLAFEAPALADFLTRFYQGRVPLQQLRDGRYRVKQCRRCEFVYQDPILDAVGMQALYQDWVDDRQSLLKKQTANSKRFRQYATQVQTLIQLTGRRPQQLRVLDFGMGWGYWSRMAQAHGLEVTGCELSAKRRQHALELGIRSIESLPEQRDQFDCIYANQVFEHLPEPRQNLRQLVGCLADDGLLYIRVPDGRGLAGRLAGQGWQPDMDAIHPLEHINCFTRSSLLRMGAEAGLVPINPPLRLHWGSLLSGLKREIADRYRNTHVFFKKPKTQA